MVELPCDDIHFKMHEFSLTVKANPSFVQSVGQATTTIHSFNVTVNGLDFTYDFFSQRIRSS